MQKNLAPFPLEKRYKPMTMASHFFSQDYFLPHGHCYLWQPALLWTHFTTDLLIGLSYVAISATLYFLVRKIELPFSPVVLAFGAFIGACGATHFIEVWTLWYPSYWVAAAVKALTAVASVTTAIWLFLLRGAMVRVAKSTRVAEDRRVALEALNESLEERVRLGVTIAEKESLYLRQVSDTLAKSLDYETTLWSVAQLAVPDIADVCWIDVIGEDGLSYRAEAFKGAEENAELNRSFKNYPSSLTEIISPLTKGLKDDAVLISEIKGEFFESIGANSAFAETLRKVEITSFLAVPLTRRGRTLGVICLATRGSNRLDAHALKLALELSHRSSFALDNALLYLKQIHATEALTLSQTELEKAVKVRDEFMSIASHELRTPLTSLKLQNQIRQRKLRKGEENFTSASQVEKMLLEDSKQIDRLNRLVDDMLDIARLHTGKLTMVKEVFDLGELLREAADRFQLQFREADCELSFGFTKGIMVSADRYRVEQVIANLLTNALRYGAGKPVRLEVRKEKDRAKLIVADQGIGIARENQERIFQRFERAVSLNSVSGLGLGLYIVKQILEAQGGSIEVKSELDVGSTFTADLPLLDAEGLPAS